MNLPQKDLTVPDIPNPFASLNAALKWMAYRFDRLENAMSDQHQQLIDTEGSLNTAITATAQRVNAKLDALGVKVTDLQTQLANATGTQIDLAPDIADLQTEISALNAIAADPAPAPEPTTDVPPPPA